MLSYKTQTVDGAFVVRFRGSLDALTVPEIRPNVDRLVGQSPIRMVVDLSDVAMIDSTGVALIVSLFKRLRATGGQIRVAGITGQPREIFHFLKLDESLPMSGSVDEALIGL